MELESEMFCRVLKGEEYDVELLNSLLKESPWFSMIAAVLIRDLKSVGDEKSVAKLRNSYALSFTANSYSGVASMLRSKLKRDLHKESRSIDAINGFLDKKNKRVKLSPPKVNDMSQTLSEASEVDIVSEQFAKILISQGYNERAKQIYRQLSLVNPEKSVYFASRIDELD
ncbi:MAG: hypothetical protein R3Y04_09170 [Rikenellaceae bacterium]